MAAFPERKKRTIMDVINTDKNEEKHEMKRQERPVLPGKIYVARFSNQVEIPKRNDTDIIIIAYSPHNFGVLSQHILTDEDGRVVNNIRQFSKLFTYVDEQKQLLTQSIRTESAPWRWQHEKETHIDPILKIPTEKYWAWRKKGMANPFSVSYPNGYNSSNFNSGFLVEAKPSDDDIFCVDMTTQPPIPYRRISALEERKVLFCPLYTRLCTKHPKFIELMNHVNLGRNIIIADCDGPLFSWFANTPLCDLFTIENCMLIDKKETIQFLLNDTRHPFGHGYAIAALLNDMTGSWFQT